MKLKNLFLVESGITQTLHFGLWRIKIYQNIKPQETHNKIQLLRFSQINMVNMHGIVCIDFNVI